MKRERLNYIVDITTNEKVSYRPEQDLEVLANRLTKEAEESTQEIIKAGFPTEKKTSLTDTFSSVISGLFGSDKYSDVTVIHKNINYPAHRVILAASSEVFKCTLSGQWCDSTKCLQLPDDCSSVIVRTFLHYFYGYSTLIDHSNVVWLFLLANKYQGETREELSLDLLIDD